MTCCFVLIVVYRSVWQEPGDTDVFLLRGAEDDTVMLTWRTACSQYVIHGVAGIQSEKLVVKW